MKISISDEKMQGEEKIKFYEYVSNKDNLLVKDIHEREKLFKKYAVHYKDKKWSEKEREKYVTRQKYLYDGLYDKQIEQTNVEKLLEITLNELQIQETVKQSIDNKIGFAVAYFGILIGIFIQDGFIYKLVSKTYDINLFIIKRYSVFVFFACLAIIIILIFFDVYKALMPKKYEYLILDDDEYENFRAAVDDKRIALVALLESATYAVTKNRKTNDKKANELKNLIKKLIYLTILLLCATILVI